MTGRKLSKLLDKTLLQYIWSFLLVLLLPLGIFFLIYNRYFFNTYQDEVFERYSTEIDTLEARVETQIQWMRTIAGQLENQQTCQRDNIQKDAPNYSRITNTFASIVSPQKFFSSMGFYSSYFPDTVFTSRGTYNLKYYKKYGDPGQERQSLREIAKTISGETWYTPEQIVSASGNGGNSYDFIIPISYSQTGYIIFSIPEQSFDGLAGNADFIILDHSGRILFSNFQASECLAETIAGASVRSVRLDEGKILFCRHSTETGLYMGLLYPEETVLAPVRETQRLFSTVFFLLSALGGILVFVMAGFNYRPIRKLSEIANSHVRDIPRELSGTNAVGYALKSMESRMRVLEESAYTERTILGLVYGRETDEVKRRDSLRRIGLPERAQGYGAVLVYQNETDKDDTAAEIFRRELEAAGFACCGMEYPAGACRLFLTAYEKPAASPEAVIRETAEKIHAQTGKAVHIIVGKFGADPGRLRNSFRQAVQMQHGVVEEMKVIFCGDAGTSGFYYPQLEIQSLSRSLQQLDAERFSLMYGTLIDALHEDGVSSFTTGAVYCDMINCCLIGMQGICPGEPEIEALYSGLYCDMDLQALSEMAEKVKREALTRIYAARSRQEELDSVVKEVRDYIDGNYRSEEMNVSYVAHAFGLSVSNLSHRFKAATGKNISDYIKEKRLQYTKELLADTELTIGDIAVRLGYTQPSNFIRTFKSQTGMTPNEFRTARAQEREGSPDVKQGRRDIPEGWAEGNADV